MPLVLGGVLVLVLGSVRLSEGGGPIISGGVYYLRLEPWHSVVVSRAECGRARVLILPILSSAAVQVQSTSFPHLEH